MCVQVIGYETPGSSGIGTDQSVNVFEKIFLGSSLANQRRKDLTGGNVKISKQTERSMSNVFVFTTSKRSASRKQISGNSLQRLDTGLFIDRDRVNPLRVKKLDGIAVSLADFEDLSIPCIGIINFWKQPVLTSMRLNIGAILKKTTPLCVKCLAQFRV